MSIIFKDIAKIYNGKHIFENLSGKINEGDRIGLIGINGVGKTTLIRILMGLLDRDSGEVIYTKENLSFGYLSQYNEFDVNSTIYDELYNAGLMSIKSSFNQDSYNTKLKRTLLEAGFMERDFNQLAIALSGGEKTKLSICKILIKNPDILILDEPTNHLDMESINWLTEFINKIDKTLIIISHDRQFLDDSVSKIFEMKCDSINEYKGNYSEYKVAKENEIKCQQREYEKQTSEIRHLKEIISERKTWFDKAHKDAGQNDFLRAKAKKHISIMRAKEKQLERLEEGKVKRPEKDMLAAFEHLVDGIADRKLPEYLIQARDINKSFGKNIIFNNASMDIRRGDKIALIGKNGSGKSTLIKLLLGQEKPNQGYITTNPSLKIGYFSQELENLNFQNSILDEILETGVSMNYGRIVLGSLLFKGDTVYKKIEVLSMGEKCRVAFAKLILSSANMLILDEPTNYMDIVSREKIEEVISNYSGTILFVSHDRYFVRNTANRMMEIDDKKIKTFDGNYEYYLAKKTEKTMEKNLGINITNIKDEIRRLECELAFISGRLSIIKLSPEEKEELNSKFIKVSRSINEHKKML